MGTVNTGWLREPMRTTSKSGAWKEQPRSLSIATQGKGMTERTHELCKEWEEHGTCGRRESCIYLHLMDGIPDPEEHDPTEARRQRHPGRLWNPLIDAQLRGDTSGTEDEEEPDFTGRQEGITLETGTRALWFLMDLIRNKTGRIFQAWKKWAARGMGRTDPLVADMELVPLDPDA